MGAFVVRRGMDDSYYRYLRIMADANGTELIIDRRLRDRRETGHTRGTERRAGDRRAEPSETWTRDGYLVVRQDS